MIDIALFSFACKTWFNFKITFANLCRCSAQLFINSGGTTAHLVEGGISNNDVELIEKLLTDNV